jgi:hypothetical protein
MEGRKTYEARLSRKAVAPYRRVARGDLILVKRAAGPIVATCRVFEAWSRRLSACARSEVRERFSRTLCVGDDFWREKSEASFMTLIELRDVRAMPALRAAKTDRRGWVVLASRTDTGTLIV